MIVLVALLLLASAGGVWAATGSSAATYRWATVTKADVDETVNSYGTIKPINQSVVTFPVAGTVATVPVTVGQQVVNGQTLATIAISSLQAQLDSARSTLATAQAKLASDTQAQEDGTTVSNSGASSSMSVTPADFVTAVVLRTHGSGGSGGSSGSGGSAASAAQGAVTAAQSKLLADQQNVDALLSSVAADLRSGTATCGTLITSLQNLPATDTPPSAAPSASPTPAAPTTTSPAVPDTSACTALLNKVLADQQSVASAQNAVGADETALTQALAQLLAAAKSGSATSTPTPTPSPSPSPSRTPSASPSPQAGSGQSGEGGRQSRTSTGSAGGSGAISPGTSSAGSGRSAGSSGGGGGVLVTAQQLVLDQATVDADTAGVTEAEQSLNQARLVSPITGTVAQISVKPGASVAAQSSAVTVIGTGVDQVTTTVGDLDLDKVRLGAQATVVPDGTNTPVRGTVTAVGLLPVSTSSSTTGATATSGSAATSSATDSATYPVTISLDSGGLYAGSGADVSIVVQQKKGVVTVPTSAVTTFGTLHSVTLSSGGKVVRKIVDTGASDATRTQVTSGLKVGDRVVLAKMNTPVPSSGTTTLTGRTGSFGGGGFGAATRAGGGGFTRGAGTTRG